MVDNGKRCQQCERLFKAGDQVHVWQIPAKAINETRTFDPGPRLCSDCYRSCKEMT